MLTPDVDTGEPTRHPCRHSLRCRPARSSQHRCGRNHPAAPSDESRPRPGSHGRIQSMRRTIGAACVATLSLLTACGGASGADPQLRAPVVEQREVTENSATTAALATCPFATPRVSPTPTLTRAAAMPISLPTPTPKPSPTAAPTEIPATPTRTPETTEIHPGPSPSPTLDADRLISRGKRLVERNNCLGCHSIDDQASSAPALKGLFGATRQLKGGATVIVDKAYLLESIKQPDAKIVDGYFTGAMPKVFFSAAELPAMVGYIASLD